MNRQAQLIIGALLAVVVGLGVTVGVLAAGDDNSPTSTSMDAGDAYMGMMGAIADTGSGVMVDHMREVLGEEGYQRMLDHVAAHREGGTMTDDAGMDQMMTDGVMQKMPADSGNVTPPANGEHHETPAP